MTRPGEHKRAGARDAVVHAALGFLSAQLWIEMHPEDASANATLTVAGEVLDDALDGYAALPSTDAARTIGSALDAEIGARVRVTTYKDGEVVWRSGKGDRFGFRVPGSPSDDQEIDPSAPEVRVEILPDSAR